MSIDLRSIKTHWQNAVHQAAAEIEISPISERLPVWGTLMSLTTKCAEKHTCKGELVYKIASNGHKKYRIQCKTCGNLSNWVAHSRYSRAQIEAAEPVSDEVYTKIHEYRKEVIDFYETKWRDEQKEIWDTWYSHYLQSPKWRAKRQKVMERAGRKCEGCLENPAVSIHHKNYSGVGDELLYDLVALCDECHRKAEEQKGKKASA